MPSSQRASESIQLCRAEISYTTYMLSKARREVIPAPAEPGAHFFLPPAKEKAWCRGTGGWPRLNSEIAFGGGPSLRGCFKGARVMTESAAHVRVIEETTGAAPYGFQGADFDSLMARLLVFDPSRPFLGAGRQKGSPLSLISPPATRHCRFFSLMRFRFARRQIFGSPHRT
jgi:hypothetical protein